LDIHSLVDAQAQADPKFQSTFLYARISARAVREALVSERGYEFKRLYQHPSNTSGDKTRKQSANH
ncbi:MAG: hypothetical protein ACR2LR_27975, partial [Hassallia sp.]